MKSLKLAVSLLALSLLAVPAIAQDATTGTDNSAAQNAEASPRRLPPAVQVILDQGTDFSGFTPDQLRKRQAAARKFASNERFSPEVRTRLREIAVAANAALAQGQKQRPQQVAKPKPQVKPKPVVVEQVRPAPQKPVVKQPTFGSSNANADSPGDGVDQPQTQRPVKPVQPSTPTARNAQAAEILADRRPADKLSDQDLRVRVKKTRQVLAITNLSADVSAALRNRLQSDSQALRERQAAANNRPDRNQVKKPGTSISVNINLGPPAIVLQDRRPGDALTTEELQHRIQIYRDIESSGEYRSYRQDERDYWRRTMLSDRQLLRRRLLDERHRREAEIAQEQNSGQLDRDIVINIAPQPDVEVYDDVYVAEADDRQIEDVLIAPPRERITRRYTVDEITSQPELRRAVPRLELDTIHFGFGESIVREEEVRNLDRIGSVIEKILKRYPREVFLIEGHTDAVGSDLSNLYLSRSRAEAVKQALVTYYDIPARNLQTAGLGERYLKIQTPDAEAENRRVSIGRVTQFIGEAQ